jgi:hypothetical protein
MSKTIGFIGNFIPSFSTENERKKAFEELGHTVIAYQESETTAEQLLEDMNKLDMLVYSHTHDPNYIIDGLIEVFNVYKANHIPTVSAHLDRWLWLDRVKDMGVEATWFTEYIFMADASPEAAEKYNELGLNWYYLKPAVAKDQCYLAQPDYEKYPHEIIFTGSRGYHPEYPFRPELIDFLKETYGERFGHYGNDGIKVLREAELNQALITAKIVVGDSCFGGRPNYVSDRYYETRGRGGFLLHPKVEGVDYIGVGFYNHADLRDVKRQIDYWLGRDDNRERLRIAGFDQVQLRETYTNRAQEILDIVFKGEK